MGFCLLLSPSQVTFSTFSRVLCTVLICAELLRAVTVGLAWSDSKYLPESPCGGRELRMRRCVSHLSRWRDLETVIDMDEGHCRDPLSWYILCSLGMEDKSCELRPCENSGRNHLLCSASTGICTWSVGLTVKVIIILSGRAIQDPILYSIQETTFIVYYQSFHDLLNVSTNIIRIISPQNIISP